MAQPMELKDALVELIKTASTTLPPDQIAALRKAAELEPEGSMSRETFELMIKNAETAAATATPTCQDTGSLLFYVDYGPEYRQTQLAEVIREAAGVATRNSKPNTEAALIQLLAMLLPSPIQQ